MLGVAGTADLLRYCKYLGSTQGEGQCKNRSSISRHDTATLLRPLTAVLDRFNAAVQAIYAHQHPANCGNAKFLVHTSHGSGLGSQLHMDTAALAMAMALGRVYVEVYSSASLYTDGEYCGENQRLDECFFEPFSSCTPEDAGGLRKSFLVAVILADDAWSPNSFVTVAWPSSCVCAARYL